MRVPDYIQFNELGVEPWSFIGMYATTVEITSSNAIHRWGTPVVHLKLGFETEPTIIHYQYSTEIHAKIGWGNTAEAQIHKVYVSLLGEPSNVNIHNAIHSIFIILFFLSPA